MSLYNAKISRIQSATDDLVILYPHGCKRLSDSIALIVRDLSPSKVEIQTLIELGFENKQEAEDYYFFIYHDQLSLIYDKENKRVIMHEIINQPIPKAYTILRPSSGSFVRKIFKFITLYASPQLTFICRILLITLS